METHHACFEVFVDVFSPLDCQVALIKDSWSFTFRVPRTEEEKIPSSLDSEHWQFTVLLSPVATHYYSSPSPANNKLDHSFQGPLFATKLY